MVLLSLSHRLNRVVGPFLLRNGLSARYALGRKPFRDSPTLDFLFMIRLGQKLVSLEIEEEATRKLNQARKPKSAFGKFADNAFDRLFGKGQEEEYYTPEQLEKMNPRMQAFEDYMRPILVPNERWSDVMRWHMHIRFLQWARDEFLAAKYGLDLKEAIDAYPQLRSGPQVSISKAKQNWKLLLGRKDEADQSGWLPKTPSTNTVLKAFQIESWSRKKDNDAVWKRMREVADRLNGEVVDIPMSNMKTAKVAPETDVSHLSVGDILEVTGAGVSDLGSFNLFCERYGIYQFWTKEYVEGLASYLVGRAQRYDGDTLVLDVGAGDGFLAQLLRESLQKIQRQSKPKRRSAPQRKVESKRIPEVVAIDDGSWEILSLVHVEKLDVEEAIEKYTKDKSRRVIILCSWMPVAEDWTATFRDHGVDEYILIGEYDDGNCGHNFETWGNTDYKFVDSDKDESFETVTPAYEVDGYKRSSLGDLTQFHFSRFDSSVSNCSKTISFKRKDG